MEGVDGKHGARNPGVGQNISDHIFWGTAIFDDKDGSVSITSYKESIRMPAHRWSV